MSEMQELSMSGGKFVTKENFVEGENIQKYLKDTPGKYGALYWQ